MADEKTRSYTQRNDSTSKPKPATPKAPPHNEDAEKLVLGALMLEKDAYPTVGEILRPECFYDTSNRLIYEAIVDLVMAEHPIDPQTVIEQLKRNKTLKKAGSEYYITMLASQINSTAHLEIHARILYDKAIQRELISFGNEVIQNAFDESIDVADTMQEAESKLFEITQRSNKDDVEPIGKLLSATLEQVEKASAKGEGISGINTGFRELDEMTSGWQPSDLVIIAARPAMGKTAFVLSMALNMAIDYNIPVAIFSLEMSKVQLTTRLLVNHLEIPNDKVKSGTLSKDELTLLTTGLGRLRAAPIYIDDNAGLSVFDLRSKARRLVREQGCQMILIDYLQLMTASGMRSSANREQEVSTISRSLKQLAKELSIPVIALSQLNRGVENREGKKPQLSDLRESGAIEQDADMVCFIHRPEYYGIFEGAEGEDLRGMAEFIVAKHRNGPTGSRYLRFVQQLIKFESNIGHSMYDSKVAATIPSALNATSISGNTVPDFGADDDLPI